MSNLQLIEKLKAKYIVLIRTEYHIQIKVENGYHNIWFTKYSNFIKCRLFGTRETRRYHPEELLIKLEKFNYEEMQMEDEERRRHTPRQRQVRALHHRQHCLANPARHPILPDRRPATAPV